MADKLTRIAIVSDDKVSGNMAYNSCLVPYIADNLSLVQAEEMVSLL